MFFRIAALLLSSSVLIRAQGPDLAAANESDTPPPAVCPAGGPIGSVELVVRSPKEEDPLPLRTINHLSEGDTIHYSPLLRGREKRPGEIALVMVPAKHDAGSDALLVTDPKPADKPQEWKVGQTISIVAYVYGPEGLSKKKVKRFLSQDDLLIAQLADYAQKTADTEALIQALSSADTSAASMNAALTGFASQYGLGAPIDRSAPPGIQAQTLFATLNPQLATYDPMTPSSSARIGQTASLTTAAAALFFGSPIGLAAGGTAMLLDLRSIAFPGTQFRSSFAEPIKTGLNLCGQRNPAPPHTRVAYIWANRVPNTPAPSIQMGKANNIPQEQKTPVPVEMPDRDWKYLDRARAWALADDRGHKTPVKVLKLQNQKSLEIDLGKTTLAPGDYHLAGAWDWAIFEAKGEIAVHPLSDFERAHLASSSQNHLLAKAGRNAVTLEDGDFEFTTKVELKKLGDEFATAEAVPFILPKGLREGPQDHMDVQIDTGALDSGQYDLLISQQDGKSHPVSIAILPNPPKIQNLPILANQGAAAQHYVLKGERLGLFARLESAAAALTLDPPSEDQTERNITVQLNSNPKPGNAYAVTAFLKDRTEPMTFDEALRITGPLPVIASSKLSLPTGMAISIEPGEFPAAAMLTALLDVKNIGPKSILRLDCADEIGPHAELYIGEQTDKSSLQQLSPDQVFLSYDTGSLPAGCSVQAVIDNGAGGRSAPYALARIVRLPRIEQFSATGEQGTDGKHFYTLLGMNLEMIEKVGWDQLTGFDVSELPAPVPGQGQKQTLRVALPDQPTPTAALYVWLRGDKTGRATTVTSTLSKNAASPSSAPAAAKAPPVSPAVAQPGDVPAQKPK